VAFGSIELHTKLLRKMKDILLGDQAYAYMSKSCVEKLTRMQHFARYSGFAKSPVTPLSEKEYAIFPWLGTKQLCALHLALEKHGVQNKVCPGGRMPLYLMASYDGNADHLEKLLEKICTSPINKYDFDLPENMQVPYKYNRFMPKELLKKQFLEDYLDVESIKRNL